MATTGNNFRILVTGSRDWDDWETFSDALHQHIYGNAGKYITIIHGGCPTGADYFASHLAKQLTPGRSSEEVHRAEWEKHGRAAGPIRNREMVDSGFDVCLAFIKNNSKGATGCAKMAEKASGSHVKYFRKDD